MLEIIVSARGSLQVLNLEVLNRYQNCDNEHMTESFYNDPEVKTNALDVSPYWEGTSKDKKFY